MNYLNCEIESDQLVNKISDLAATIYVQVIEQYHVEDSIDSTFMNKYHIKSLCGLLSLKCWIDTVQWHLEDEIRKIDLEPSECLNIKRRIDQSNQDRTNIVELIDDYFLLQYKEIKPMKNAKINTESPAWALDRLSILNLKIYHMRMELTRDDTTKTHHGLCTFKLQTLMEQHKDLCESIDELLQDIKEGVKQMKVYRQMKMYNDPDLNPVIYKSNTI